MEQLTTLKGIVERITFTNPDNGYTVARFHAGRRFGIVTVVGALANVHPGARLKIEGQWKTHPRYGDQFEIVRYVEEMPATVEGIKRYLGSGLIKGIGPVTARRIAEKFGVYTLEVIEKDIDRLVEVDGIGSKRVKIIAEAWKAQKQIKEVMLFLQSHQVNTSLAVKIYKTYGDEAITIVKNQPYCLARDVYGIGFVTADKIARSIGIALDAPQRISAGIEYTLNQLAEEGHVFAPREQLAETAADILGVKLEQVEGQINFLCENDRIKVQPLPDKAGAGLEAVYLNPFYYAEIGVARQVQSLLKADGAHRSRLAGFAGVNWDKAFSWLAATPGTGVTLAAQQSQAVQMALTNKVSILTGGPGTGKTSTIRAILRLMQTKQKQALLAAPTGRAAKRLSESTGQEAKTIHRLLEVSPGEGFKFQRNQDNPLECDLLILDECSMIDLILMNNVLKAIHPGGHLLLVGDADQLPSVGAGNVLRDLIASGVVPTTRLEVIFRQAAGSSIITNAHRINKGEMPLFPGRSRGAG